MASGLTEVYSKPKNSNSDFVFSKRPNTKTLDIWQKLSKDYDTNNSDVTTQPQNLFPQKAKTTILRQNKCFLCLFQIGTTSSKCAYAATQNYLSLPPSSPLHFNVPSSLLFFGGMVATLGRPHSLHSSIFPWSVISPTQWILPAWVMQSPKALTANNPALCFSFK